MATSHFCNGTWRDGPVSACDKHKKLSSKQATVYRGTGTPGGFSGKAPESDAGGSSGSSDNGS